MQLTNTTARVLQAFLVEPGSPQYGYDLMKAAGIKSGTLYPMLKRLVTDGVLVAEWEAQPTTEGRPPRRYYKITADGVRYARAALAEYEAASGPSRPLTGWSPAMGTS